MICNKQNLRKLLIKYYARKSIDFAFPQVQFSINISFISCYGTLSSLLNKAKVPKSEK